MVKLSYWWSNCCLFISYRKAILRGIPYEVPARTLEQSHLLKIKKGDFLADDIYMSLNNTGDLAYYGTRAIISILLNGIDNQSTPSSFYIILSERFSMILGKLTESYRFSFCNLFKYISCF